MKHQAGRLLAVAECNAELALARLVSEELKNNEELKKRLKEKKLGADIAIVHRPARGGHSRVIIETLRNLCRRRAEEAKVVLFIDYEEGAASQSYTERLCSGEKRQVYSQRGASVLVCASMLDARDPRRGESCTLEVYAVVWRPRSEEVLSALGVLSDNPRDWGRVKRDPGYVARRLAGTPLPKAVAEALTELIKLIDEYRSCLDDLGCVRLL
ncbi:MAG: hypothetical protein GXO15_01995 [Crenarchaeota archaeon]|nr:hypothetical protein [Thermoproteota archaeon]